MLKNDCATIGADCGPTHVTGFETRDLIGLAAVFGDAPDVREAIAVAIADEVDKTIVPPHGP